MDDRLEIEMTGHGRGTVKLNGVAVPATRVSFNAAIEEVNRATIEVLSPTLTFRGNARVIVEDQFPRIKYGRNPGDFVARLNDPKPERTDRFWPCLHPVPTGSSHRCLICDPERCDHDGEVVVWDAARSALVYSGCRTPFQAPL